MNEISMPLEGHRLETDIVIGECDIDFYMVRETDIWVPISIAIEQVSQFYDYYKSLWLAEERAQLETGEIYSVVPKHRHRLGESAWLIAIFGTPWYCSHRMEPASDIVYWMDPVADLLSGKPPGWIGSWEETHMEVRLLEDTLWFEDKRPSGFIAYPARRVWLKQFVPQLIQVGQQISMFGRELFHCLDTDDVLRGEEKGVLQQECLGPLLRSQLGWVEEPTDRLEAAYKVWKDSQQLTQPN